MQTVADTARGAHMETNPQALLAAISKRWECEAEAQTNANNADMCEEQQEGQQQRVVDLAPDEPPFDASTTSTICAKAGELCGRRCKDVDSGARHLVHMIRNFPFRPYLTTDGGVYIRVAASLDWQADNADLVEFFHRLWWTAAGDAVLDRHRADFPLRDPVRPVVYGLPAVGAE